MKKFSLQAETHSEPDGPPRTSPAFYYFFLFLFRLQAQAHSKPDGAHALHLPPLPSFFYRLQAQAPSTTELTPSMCKIFFIF